MSSSSSSIASAASGSRLLPLLPEDFPRNPKGCEDLTTAFFTCFSTKTLAVIKPTNAGGEPIPRYSKKEETEHLALAMKDCKASLDAYKACLTKAGKDKPAKRFRVPEEYKRLMDDR